MNSNDIYIGLFKQTNALSRNIMLRTGSYENNDLEIANYFGLWQ